MPLPDNPKLSPAAYARMPMDARVELLFEHLQELDERLQWVDAEMARHGYCAFCVMANGMPIPHECRERPLA
jgi:hypothetical protein